MTLRQALSVLESDGLIAQLPGRGTFVTPVPDAGPALAQQPGRGPAAAGRGAGHRGAGLPRRDRCRPASPPRWTGPAASRRCGWNGCAGSVGGRPCTRCPGCRSPWFETLPDVDFEEASLYRSLEQHGQLAIVRATESLRARALPAPIAKAVGKPAGRPVLVAERITYDARNLPIVHDLATIVDDSISVLAQRARRGTELSWAAHD